jgi:hypothetical protein
MSANSVEEALPLFGPFVAVRCSRRKFKSTQTQGIEILIGKKPAPSRHRNRSNFGRAISRRRTPSAAAKHDTPRSKTKSRTQQNPRQSEKDEKTPLNVGFG